MTPPDEARPERLPVHLFVTAALAWCVLTFGHRKGLDLAYAFFQWAQRPGTLSEQGGQAGMKVAEGGLAIFFGSLALLALARVALRVRATKASRRELAEALVPWVAWAAMLFAVWKTYVVYATELVHFGQYALIGALVNIALRGRRPATALLITAGLGLVDEVYQHYALHAGERYHWMDWSDLVLDALGATGGILPAATIARLEGQDLPDTQTISEKVVLVAAALLLPLLLLSHTTTSWALGHYIHFPYWGEYSNNKPTHWPGPREGIPLALGATLVLTVLVEPRRAALSQRALAGLALLWAISIDPPSRAKGTPVHEEVPTCVAARASAAPTIDGRLDEADWARAPRVGPFVRTKDGTDVPEGCRTWARVLWDDQALYVAFEAEDPDVWARDAHRDDPALPGDEVVELFLDDGGEELTYYEVEVSPKNVVYDLFCFVPTAPLDYDPNAKFVGLARWSAPPEAGGIQTAVTIDGTLDITDYGWTPREQDQDRGFTAEVTFPWALLRTTTTPPAEAHRPVPPRRGDRWRMNLYRVERRRPTTLGDDAPMPRDKAIARIGCTEARFDDYVSGGTLAPDASGLFSGSDVRRVTLEHGTLYQAWSPTWNASFHAPQFFGALEFGD